jgi:HAD superfamily hydrolase (TIGR01549 family)
VESARDGSGPGNGAGPLSRPLRPPPSALRPVVRAVTFDFWDTIYDGGNLPERLSFRQQAIATMLGAYGLELPEHDVMRLYVESAREADRWWREEHRGYTTAERLRWVIERAGSKPRADCEHIAAACDAVDEALLRYPPPLLPGAADAVRALAARVPLAIVSDTGFASGRAQDALLEQDGLLGLFAATVYSMDVGHAKPRTEPFRAAIDALGVPSPGDVVHVGDNERTDVGGALAAGLRAIRLDVVRLGGWSAAEDAAQRDDESAAEFVATSFEQLVEYVNDCGWRIAD